MQTINQSNEIIINDNIVVAIVELPDELVKLAEELGIDIQEVVTNRLMFLKDIFP